MENKNYNVLFVDDKINSPFVEGFIDLAEMNGINIDAIQLHNEAINKLKADINNEYDAVILDVMGYHNKADGNEDKTGVRETLIAIRTIKKEQGKLIPWFIFTGELKDYKEKEFLKEIKIAEEETAKFSREDLLFYTKGSDNQNLLEDVIKAIENNKNKTILYKFKKPLQILEELKASDEIFKSYIEILKSISNLEVKLNTELYLNNLRKIVELIFRGLVKIKVLPPNFIVDDKVNIAESSKFLSGQNAEHIGYKAKRTYFNKGLANSLQNLIFFTSSGSHTSEKPNESYIDYKTYSYEIGENSFILYQLSFVVLDLLLAYNKIKEKTSSTDYREYWEKIEHRKQEIVQIEYDGEQYFSGEYMFYKKYVEDNNHQNKQVKINEYKDNDNYKTKYKYPFFVSKYELVKSNSINTEQDN